MSILDARALDNQQAKMFLDKTDNIFHTRLHSESHSCRNLSIEKHIEDHSTNYKSPMTNLVHSIKQNKINFFERGHPFFYNKSILDIPSKYKDCILLPLCFQWVKWTNH